WKHPVQLSVEAALLGGGEVIVAGARTRKGRMQVTVKTHNESYWYMERKRLGGFRHMYRSHKYNPATFRWDASYYEMKERSSDSLVVPTLCLAGSNHLTALAADKAAQLAQKARDMNPADWKNKPSRLTPGDLMCDHLRVVIVSQSFVGLSNSERMSWAYEALAASFCPNFESCGPEQGVPQLSPERLKGYSYIGKHVRALPHFRHLGLLQAKLLICCRTSAQNMNHPRTAAT
ncbi:unnamed protein product, partial [Chrysoparadoxa australica]